MALQTRSDQDEIITGINVTPLVDVAFVVLIIFIVTASMVLKDSIPVQLPQAQSAEDAGQGLLNIAITGEGAIYINGKTGSIEVLPAAVAEARERAEASGRQVTAFVSADVKAAYGVFAGVVDRLRLEGVVDIALDTQPVELGQRRP